MGIPKYLQQLMEIILSPGVYLKIWSPKKIALERMDKVVIYKRREENL